MSLLIESDPTATPELSPRSPVQLVRAAPGLWRVLALTGHAIGHLQAIDDTGGTRYRARRFHTASHTFRDLGDFWNADDAIECLRFAR